MVKDQTEFISEELIAGHGNLEWRDLHLRECDFKLTIRKSRLIVKKDVVVVYIITTMIGTISIDGDPFGDMYTKRNQLILHINDDFLVPICAFPTATDQKTFRIYGRIISKPAKRLRVTKKLTN
jgi:hypothetical protein